MQAPDTIAGVLFLLCGSYMLSDFLELACLSKKERDRRFKDCGKRYSMGSLVGTDGVERKGIDENVLIRESNTERND